MHPVVELQQIAAGVLQGLDLVVSAGDRIGVVGRPGSGKTALVELLVGAREAEDGRIRRDGVDVTDRLGPWRQLGGLGWVAQRPRPFAGLSVYENVVAAATANLGWRARVAEAHARRSIIRTGLARVADKPAGSLDVHDAKRLEVARVIAVPRRLVVVDQLSDGLDDSVRAELTSTLMDSLDDGAALIWMDVVDSPPMAVDRLVVLAFGRIVVEGPPEVVLTGPEMRSLRYSARDAETSSSTPLTRMASTAPLRPLVRRDRSVSPPLTLRPQNPQPAAAPGSSAGTPNPVDPYPAPPYPAWSPPSTGDPTNNPGKNPTDVHSALEEQGWQRPALSVRGWSAPVGGPSVVADVAFDVVAGEVLSITGRPGSGKSVLLRSLAGFVDAVGVVELDGEDVGGLAPFERVRRGLRLVPQRGGIVPELKVSENLSLSARRTRRPLSDQRHAGQTFSVETIYDIFEGLARSRNRRVDELPPFEQRALVLARALMCQPRVLLIDDLPVGLPDRSAALLFDVVASLGPTIAVVVTDRLHGPSSRIAHRTATLVDGRVRTAAVLGA